LHPADLVEGHFAQAAVEFRDFSIDTDKPLFGSAEDDGCFAAPAVGILVGDFGFMDEQADFTEMLIDFAINSGRFADKPYGTVSS
jgi:hypothetical protein